MYLTNNMISIPTRKVTCELLDLVDQGMVSPKTLLEACLVYMSEKEVRDMAVANGYIEQEH